MPETVPHKSRPSQEGSRQIKHEKPTPRTIKSSPDSADALEGSEWHLSWTGLIGHNDKRDLSASVIICWRMA